MARLDRADHSACLEYLWKLPLTHMYAIRRKLATGSSVWAATPVDQVDTLEKITELYVSIKADSNTDMALVKISRYGVSWGNEKVLYGTQEIWGIIPAQVLRYHDAK